MRTRKKIPYNNRLLKIGIVCLLLMYNSIVNAQIVMPSMGVYDTSSQMMYLNSLREMSNYTNQLRPIISKVQDTAYNEYLRGNYQECIEIVTGFFDDVTIYKAQEPLCVYLYEIAGMAYLKTGNNSQGIEWLRISMNLGNKNAYSVLSDLFYDYFNKARLEYEKGDYRWCHAQIQSALSTGIHNSNIYVLQGDAYLKQYFFNESRKCYKQAKKMGYPLAKDCFRKLKIAKKDYYLKK